MLGNRTTARPIASTLKVEIISSERGTEGNGTSGEGSASSPATAPQQVDYMESARTQRMRTMQAVQLHGGRATGAQLTRRERCRRRLNSIWWISGQLLACVFDVSMLIAELNGASLTLVDVVTLFVLLAFCADLGLRAFTYRRMLLRSPWAWFDFTIVGLSVILYFVGLANRVDGGSTTSSRSVGTGLRSLIITLRWVRALRAVSALVKTGGAGRSAARQLTGQNKRRYVDLEAGFDLDLVYVRPRLIAMSVPSTGCTSLYRNPLSEVARFLETRHRTEGYLIVNCCPELPYSTAKFQSGTVVCYDVQDHTPPTMAQFVEFLNHAAASAARGRLLAVHCRGGKGRTGSMCCAWLLYTKECADADDALNLFALERTELALGRKKLQGVETPSQRRYVHQVAALLQSQQAYFPAGSDPMLTPLAAPLRRRRDARRLIAGKEPGCLFFFLFHTGFVGASDEYVVPLLQMDRAFKNKKREFRWEGEACLKFVRRGRL